jgi:hypothetical protein
LKIFISSSKLCNINLGNVTTSRAKIGIYTDSKISLNSKKYDEQTVDTIIHIMAKNGSTIEINTDTDIDINLFNKSVANIMASNNDIVQNINLDCNNSNVNLLSYNHLCNLNYRLLKSNIDGHINSLTCDRNKSRMFIIKKSVVAKMLGKICPDSTIKGLQ